MLAAGPTATMLEPALIRQLYGVEVDIATNARTGPADGDSRRASRTSRRRHEHRPANRHHVAALRHRRPSLVCLLAPLVGSTSIRSLARLRLVDSVRGQHRRADLLRRAPAARARRRPGRLGAGRVWRRAAGSAAEPARDAVYARRLCRRGTRRNAGADAGSAVRHRRVLCGAHGQLRRLAWRRRHRLRARARAASRSLDQCAAARRRHAELVLLGADSVRAVPVGLHADVSHRPLADGRSRRQQLRAAGGGACRPSRCRLAHSPCCRDR